jgi:hypothetical protein
MNVETGAEAALFPEKEYINGIFVAVYVMKDGHLYMRKCAKSFWRISLVYDFSPDPC